MGRVKEAEEVMKSKKNEEFKEMATRVIVC